MTYVDLPSTPCDCITVDATALACVAFVGLGYWKRQKRLVRQHQLLNPRELSLSLQRAADAVLLCDVSKLLLGLLTLHGLMYVHEALVSAGGRDETRYYYVIHVARTIADVVVGSIMAHVVWRVVIWWSNHLVAEGHVEGSEGFFAALRASGRYNSTYALNWDNEENMDFRVDRDDPTSPHMEPSVLHHRVTLRVAEEEAEEEDIVNPRAQLRPTSITSPPPPNPYDPLMVWWRYQVTVWCSICLIVGIIIVGLQLLWRELLGEYDPLLYVLRHFTDLVAGSGDFVCAGLHDGTPVLGVVNHDVAITVFAWLGVIVLHVIVACATLAVLHGRQKYTGRTVHPMLQ